MGNSDDDKEKFDMFCFTDVKAKQNIITAQNQVVVTVIPMEGRPTLIPLVFKNKG